MSLKEWDKELECVAREIKTVQAEHAKSRMNGNKALIVRKVAIIQTQLSFERSISLIKKLTERDYLLLPHEKTLVHFGTVYLDKVQKVFALRTNLLTKTLWVKLIKTRLTGPELTDSTHLDADDLVELSLRQANLTKTESYLAKTLVKLRRQRKQLVHDYEQLGIVDANRQASGTLYGRLGLTPEDALQSPELMALQSYLRRITTPLTAPKADRRHRLAQDKYAKETANLIGAARNFVLGAFKTPDTRPSPRDLDRFQQAMRELGELEVETRRAFELIGEQLPEPARPILMQKSAKNATNIPSA